jgi:oxaloacetate decarboxylase (Na+ extruding) subunit alpha
MPLSDDDVREILRLIDGSQTDELHAERQGYTLRATLDPDRPTPAPTDPAVPRATPGSGDGAAVDIVDTTMRDGNQSLWSATGLNTADILTIAPTIDRVGFHAADFTSSTHMAVAVRFHHEDPWERLRLVSAAMPNTPLSYITTGMRFIAWVPADEDFMRLSFRCVVRNGIRRFQIADPSNDPARLRRMARVAREEGVEEIVIGLTYSISPVHTHAYYAERAAALADCPDMDRLYLKDPGGLLTPDAVRELAPHFLAAAGSRPAELHSHCTIGLAPFVYFEGAQAGFHVLHTAVAPLARGTSNPAAETTLRDLEAAGFSHRLDVDALAEVSAHFRRLGLEKDLPLGEPQEFDATYYHHQLAGGMVSTTRRMLDEQRRPELFDAVLEEVGRVRAEMGYPIIVTPVSQMVATQALRNVVDQERWSNVSVETIRYFLGHYGDPAAPVDPDVAERVLSRPGADELRDLEPLHLEDFRRQFGPRMSDEELLLRATMAEEQVDAMVAARTAKPPAGTARHPVTILLREVARRQSVVSLHVQTGDRVVEWHRAS